MIFRVNFGHLTTILTKNFVQKGVQLSTFHSAKGLQWQNVIIISANDGTTPLMRNGQIENGEEERRLFYVAVTRAKDELVVIHFKEENGKTPSRYIAEMGETNAISNITPLYEYNEMDDMFTFRELADYYGYQEDDDYY